MKVLLVGPTGNVGLRLIASLLTHGHNVTVYVRSSHKLESLIPASIFSQLTIVEGDALDSNAIKRATLENSCDGVINSAGVAALAPWGKSTLPQIFKAVLEGVLAAGEERKKPLRCWFMGGLGVLYFPGTQAMLSNYVPIYLAHRQNVHLLRTLPPNKLEWSMLCPSDMTPESSEISVPTKPLQSGKLVANALTPPSWNGSWIQRIPLIGRTLSAAMNAPRYLTTLEQNADFIAEDLEMVESRWVGMTVGIIDPAK